LKLLHHRLRRPVSITLLLATLPGFLSASCRAWGTRMPTELRHTVKPESEWVESEDEDELDPFVPAVNELGGAGNQNKIQALYAGTARKKAKTSVSSASLETFQSLGSFLNSLPDDNDMINKNPKIPKTASSGRVSEEERNVTFPAWVYAIKWEDDHDWHIIVGSDPNGSSPRYFNIEISGLPPQSSPDHQLLLDAREDLNTLLDGDLPGGSGYWEYEPFPVTVSGSLFYDVSHAPGVVGPGVLKPTTAWEVHPVTDIVWR
jgi:hypothetical protein